MVWARKSVGFCIDLHVFRSSSVSAVIYLGVVLDPYVRPYLAAKGPDAMFINDNARVHRACVVNQCVECKTLLPMEWTAHSLDLNPKSMSGIYSEEVFLFCEILPEILRT
ncbi:hypothetical protein TNCV_4698521 [Trichonephila clavipes]|nr:hypothetical protein TNCV_4698521 [Trichonephila clavipes]